MNNRSVNSINLYYVNSSFLLMILINSILISFAFLNLNTFFLLFYLMFSIIVYFLNKDILLILFVIFLPTNGIIPADDYLLGLLGINQINFVFCILYFITIKNEIKPSILHKRVLFFIWVLIFSYAYQFYKDAYYQIGYTPDYMSASRKLINLISKYLPLILLIKNISHPKINNLTRSSLLSGIICLSIYTVFGGFLPDIGLKASGNEISTFGVERAFGVIADGDSNTMGGFLAMSLGFLLISRIKSNKFYINAIIILTVLVIPLTGSRAGLISLISVRNSSY